MTSPDPQQARIEAAAEELALIWTGYIPDEERPAWSDYTAEECSADAVRVLAAADRVDPDKLGYAVVAVRPDDYPMQTVSSIWRDREPCDNHRAYCEAKAEQEPERYGDVRYVVAEIREVPTDDCPSV